MYGIPCHAETILKITPTGEVTTFGGPFPGEWKWHGAVTGPDGNIYCIPQMAEQVLKIDVKTQECTLMEERFPGKNKWYGALRAPNGMIYAIPQNAGTVLKIDAMGGSCTLLGSFPEGGFKWHGGNVGIDGMTHLRSYREPLPSTLTAAATPSRKHLWNPLPRRESVKNKYNDR